MRTIAFVTQKGGSGKSTLASCVAVAAQEAGEKVFIIDMDSLGSLTKWAAARGDADLPVEAVPAAKLKQVLTALEKKGVTLAVVDTPGAEHEAMNAAVKIADLCIIPARPNAFDLWASEKTRATIKECGREFAFLLNQCPPAQQNARVQMGAKALEAMGGLLTPLVQARVDYQEAAKLGRGVTEVSPSSFAAEEMRALWSSIKRRMNRIANARKHSEAKAAATDRTTAKLDQQAGKTETKIAKPDLKTTKPDASKPAANASKAEPVVAKPEMKTAKSEVKKPEAKATKPVGKVVRDKAAA